MNPGRNAVARGHGAGQPRARSPVDEHVAWPSAACIDASAGRRAYGSSGAGTKRWQRIDLIHFQIQLPALHGEVR